MSLWQRMRDRLDARYELARERNHLVRRKLIGFLRLMLDLFRQFNIDQSLMAASSLAFTTLLSLVPLMAVSFAVLRAFTPSDELSQRIGAWMMGTLLADSVSEVTKTLQEILDRVRGEAVGVLGFIFLLVTAITLFLEVEKTFNRIWRVAASRPLLARITSFYAVLTLSPAMVAGGFWVNDYLESRLGFAAGLFSVVAPWVLQATALLLVYKLLPHAQVRWRAALTGSVAAGVAFSFTQWIFNLYVTQVFSGSSSARLYGSLALIPIFFLWVYLAWIIVLLGAELAYVAQHRRSLGAAVLARRGHAIDAPPSGYLITRIFFEIAAHFRARKGGLNARRLAERLHITPNEVQPALVLLKNGGLIFTLDNEDDDVVPALPLDQVTLARLVALGEGGGYAPGQLKGDDAARRLEAVLVKAREACDVCLGTDIEQILREPPPAPRPPKGGRPG